MKLPGSAARVSVFLGMTVTHYVLFYGHRKCTEVVGINKDHPNEDKLGLVIQSWLWRGSQPPSSALGGHLKAGRGLGKLPEENREPHICWGHRLLTCGSWRQVNKKLGDVFPFSGWLSWEQKQ